MRIVVLDGYTLNPGDLSWDGLSALGPCEIHDRTAPDLTLTRAHGAEIVLTNKTLLSKEQIEALPHLKFISVLATGVNVVDSVAARAQGIPVSNVPAYGTNSVAQMTFALLLELTQHVGHHAQTVRDGRWIRSPDFCYWDMPLIELHGKTLGVIGAGRIGRAVIDLGLAFQMKVLAHSRSAPPNENRFQHVELEQLLRESDVVSLHCPLTPETKHLINTERLAWMRPSAFLLNTSRGPLVDDHALARALNAEELAGAGLDVLSVEPPNAGNPLLMAKNCLITPHIAWATHAARARLMNTTVANVKAFLDGKPQNVVN